jgi:hypothetical protein
MIDHQGTESFSPEEIEGIQRALRILEEAIQQAQYNNAGTVSQFFVDIFNQLGHSDLSKIEELLRDSDSRIHLIAVPAEFFGDQFEATLPHSPHTLKFALWVCMNGPDEARKTLSQHRITSEENNENLHECGFLGPIMH